MQQGVFPRCNEHVQEFYVLTRSRVSISCQAAGMVTVRKLIGTYRPQVLGPDGQPLLQRPNEWKGLILERLVIPTSAECGPQFTGMPVLFASKYSPGRRWYRCNGITREIPLVAPGLDFLGAAYERDHERWECEPGGETLCVRLHPSIIERYIQEEAHHFDLDTKYSHRDDFLVSHLFSLANEIQMGLPNGVLFAEGLSLMILGWIGRHYTNRPAREVTCNGTLSIAQQARIREFIDTFLDSSLSVEQMAAEVGISPFYFSRLFRASFGMTPHRYVLQMRIARAASLLLQSGRRRTIADIAHSTGFASQAHLTAVFNRYLGCSPARWRAGKNDLPEERE